MRNKILFCLLFLICSVYSQPVLNDFNFPIAETANAFRANTIGYSNGATGENVIWDYSTINLTSTNYSYSLVPMSSTPDYSVFPSANYCYKFIDFTSIIYNYYSLSNSSFELLGYNFDGIVGDYSQNSSVFLTFPYTYNTIINDTYQSATSTNLNTVTRTYDGYGTLKTPFGIFNNVIRQKEVGAGGTTYYWMTTNPYQIIISGNFNNPTVLFFQGSNLSLPEKSKNSLFAIYPNVTDDEFTIKTSELDVLYYYCVFDCFGKKIIENPILNSETKVSLKQYQSGLYLLRITDKNQNILHSDKIIKK